MGPHGGTRRARRKATRAALKAAVWQATARWVVDKDRTPALRARLEARVRALVRWYRTRLRRRRGNRYRVVLDVIVDSAALRARLRTLGVPLHPPGVALRITAPPVLVPVLRQGIATALGRIGVRVSSRAPVALWVSGQAVSAARLDAGSDTGAVRAVRATVRLQASLVRSPEAAASRVRSRDLWTAQVTQLGVGTGVDEARRDGARRAVQTLSARLAAVLLPHLPDGIGRRLWVRVAGAPLRVRLALARRLARQVPGVWSAAPEVLLSRETWVALVSVHGVSALAKALAALPPVAGWTFTVTPFGARMRGRAGPGVAVVLSPQEENE